MLQSVEHAKGWTHGRIGNCHIVQLAAQQTAQCLDASAGPGGKIGQRSVLDLAVFTEGFAQQDGGRRVAIGNFGNVHADTISIISKTVKQTNALYMTTIVVPKTLLLLENPITLLQTAGRKIRRTSRLQDDRAISPIETSTGTSTSPTTDHLAASFCRETRRQSSPPWTRRGGRGHRPRRGWFEPLAKNHTSSGIPATHTTPVALRATSPPHLRRGVFLVRQFRDRN